MEELCLLFYTSEAFKAFPSLGIPRSSIPILGNWIKSRTLPPLAKQTFHDIWPNLERKLNQNTRGDK